MWYDNWHPLSPLIENFGERILDDSNLALDAKLESIIQGNSCNWPSVGSDLILELISSTPTALIPSERNKRVFQNSKCNTSMVVQNILDQISFRLRWCSPLAMLCLGYASYMAVSFVDVCSSEVCAFFGVEALSFLEGKSEWGNLARCRLWCFGGSESILSIFPIEGVCPGLPVCFAPSGFRDLLFVAVGDAVQAWMVSPPGWLGIVLVASCQRWVQWGVLGGCLWLLFVALAYGL
ncbi:hypothetical protein Acr_09g0007320 [Actinidia rufa]|uniref:Uncharacterized protein n=1 Tax=Actinidia rufa TaxID=165716 RepID=A0A7J0F772_9ERIC|nr:hypothetical protein Acr_09g0007320 [Actinidia rufa]